MTKYSEKDISFFKTELEKLRAKPQMYIGPTDDAGIFTIIREPSDNAVDEARAGRNKLIHIFVTGKDFWIVDEGVGIPVKKHPEAKISTLTHVLTALQSSGKMKGDAYKSAIGTHGVGIKATNALSKEFEVWTYRADAGGWHYTRFECGTEKVKPKKATPPKLPDGTKPKKGTVVRFVPDEKIFGKAKLQPSQLQTWCEMTAYMNAGLKIRLTNPKGKTQEWFSKEGIKEYLDKRLAELKATPLNKKPLFHVSDSLELAVSFADVEGSEMQFFTNTIRNIDKGFHADMFHKALVDSLKSYRGKLEFTPSDLQEGLVGILNYKIDAPQFSSQTKEKLVDVRMKKPCYDECLQVFTAYWASNKSLAKEICQRASELRKKTAEFLKDKKLIKNVKSAGSGLASKLAGIAANSKVPISERELYLVEGDSAGGTAKLARDKSFQATFATLGKPLNVMEASKDAINKSKEIAGIMASIGLDMGKKNVIDSLKFGKIVYLADPDVDGKHIQCLFSAMFWKFLPDLFKLGKIYIVLAPEYMAKHKGKYVFGMTKEAVYKKVGSTKIDVRHIKGWGEVNAEAMREIAFEKGKRRLLRVLPPRDKAGVRRFEELMGKSPEFRKKLLGVVK